MTITAVFLMAQAVVLVVTVLGQRDAVASANSAEVYDLPTVAASDVRYTTRLVQVGLKQVYLNSLVKRSGQSEAVKKYSEQEANFTEQTLTKVREFASRKNIIIPAELTEDELKSLQPDHTLSGLEVDKKYLSLTTRSYQSLVEDLRFAKITDPELKSFYENHYPQLLLQVSNSNQPRAELRKQVEAYERQQKVLNKIAAKTKKIKK
ncbi:MAG: DUF4142 domain-containing protein [Verrucomicrobiota bacterium]|nr:DUF4142 domain-containing protein [Verrucomicrobiota bacterium]